MTRENLTDCTFSVFKEPVGSQASKLASKNPPDFARRSFFGPYPATNLLLGTSRYNRYRAWECQAPISILLQSKVRPGHRGPCLGPRLFPLLRKWCGNVVLSGRTVSPPSGATFASNSSISTANTACSIFVSMFLLLLNRNSTHGSARRQPRTKSLLFKAFELLIHFRCGKMCETCEGKIAKSAKTAAYMPNCSRMTLSRSSTSRSFLDASSLSIITRSNGSVPE